MVSFPSFSSFFTSKIVLRILGGVNVGADTQQCLVILRWISLITAAFIYFSYLNSVTLEKLLPNHRKPSDFESPKGERNNTPPTKHLLTTLQPWNKTSPSPSSSSFSLFSSPLPASWFGPCRITSHFSRRRGPLMKRVVEGKNNGGHPSLFYSLLFLFFTPVTINETISEVCAFRYTRELRWTGRCDCSCLLFRPSTTGTYTDYSTAYSTYYLSIFTTSRLLPTYNRLYLHNQRTDQRNCLNDAAYDIPMIPIHIATALYIVYVIFMKDDAYCRFTTHVLFIPWFI